jgi:micrococcal nuclease
MKRLLAIAFLVAACGGASSGDATSPSAGRLPLAGASGGLATEAPLATEEPVTDPTAKPNASPLNVKVTAYSKSVRAGSNASIAIKTNPGADCTINVEYASGASTAAGLEPKQAGTTGSVVWKWKVGSHTTKGSWPITIECDHGGRSGTVTRNFTVK